MSLADLEKLSAVREFYASGEAQRIREELRLSRVEVAEALGVKLATLTNWETGRVARPRGEAPIRYFDLLAELSEERT